MKQFNSNPIKNTTLLILGLALLVSGQTMAQCTPLGNETTYGTGTTWIGYVYGTKTFTTYKGYVNEGGAGSSNFDESFGGDNVTYNTNGCSITTENFSVRYKLTQTFANGNYLFTVGGDDGYRLSLDGGATWVINNFTDHGYATSTYTVALNGATNMVLEFYENGGGNRVSFNVTPICSGTGNPNTYGTSNVWQAYLYQGVNFDLFKGVMTEGTAMNPNFDESFGSANGTYNTNSCSITTENFSARYRLTKTMSFAKYIFTVGGDDGYRLSLDGGATWAINNWGAHSYTTTSYTANLSGTYNMVLEYYENGGDNRISFSVSSTLLPVTLVSWSVAALSADMAQLQWKTTDAVNFDHFLIQRSTDGVSFSDIHTITGNGGSAAQVYSYTDQFAYDGTAYYRLVMVDKDGSFTYSNIISLQLKSAQGVRIYPTVVENGTLFIEASGQINGARLELFDMTGRKLNEKDWASLSGRQQVSIDANGHMPAGFYVARLSNNNTLLAKQIIIVK